MPTVKIEGVPPYDGEYPLDLNMTNREWHTIKQVAGIRAGELEEAIIKQDLDLVVALAVNALRRSGHTVNVDALWDAEAGKISLVGDEADAVPPPNGSGESAPSVAAPPISSGISGSETGAPHQANDPNPTGTPV